MSDRVLIERLSRAVCAAWGWSPDHAWQSEEVQRVVTAFMAMRLAESWPEQWGDQPLPEDAEIAGAHPMITGRDDLYAEAMRLVGARRSKAALVDLVGWLLLKAEGRT